LPPTFRSTLINGQSIVILKFQISVSIVAILLERHLNGNTLFESPIVWL
jgi:hypothetical protein